MIGEKQKSIYQISTALATVEVDASTNWEADYGHRPYGSCLSSKTSSLNKHKMLFLAPSKGINSFHLEYSRSHRQKSRVFVVNFLSRYLC
jgi:hypothetical protein